jgi:hypothetical protein
LEFLISLKLLTDLNIVKKNKFIKSNKLSWIMENLTIAWYCKYLSRWCLISSSRFSVWVFLDVSRHPFEGQVLKRICDFGRNSSRSLKFWGQIRKTLKLKEVQGEHVAGQGPLSGLHLGRLSVFWKKILKFEEFRLNNC